jgi:hypothetical protein
MTPHDRLRVRLYVTAGCLAVGVVGLALLLDGIGKVLGLHP